MFDYYILIRPWAVYVKEAQFFIDQGGLVDEWGENWKLVSADSIEGARNVGYQMRGYGPKFDYQQNPL